MQVKISGDVVELFLNGRSICQQPLSSDNSRQFGLFHYADQSELRVRNLQWTGDWLPHAENEKQELAADEIDQLDQTRGV
jgi:hypothetical protein